MKIFRILFAVALVGLVSVLLWIFGNYFSIVTDSDGSVKSRKFFSWVDPFWATGGYGLTSGMLSPAASSAFGPMRVGPDTSARSGWDRLFGNMATSGYYHYHNRLLGFSHTRLLGTALREGGILRISPVSNLKDILRGKTFSRFKNEWQHAEPGFYSYENRDDHWRVAMTAYGASSIQEYRNDKDEDLFLFIDLASTIGQEKWGDSPYVSKAMIKWVDQSFIGHVINQGAITKQLGGQKTYFALAFESQVNSWGWVLPNDSYSCEASHCPKTLEFDSSHKTGGVWLKVAPNSKVKVTVSLSLTSHEKAKKHLSDWRKLSLAVMREKTQSQWQRLLATISIQAEPEEKQLFYSALFQTLRMPTLWGSDVSCLLEGVSCEGESFQFSDISLWDTFRTVQPLWSLWQPNLYATFVDYLLFIAEKQQHLPLWPLGNYDGQIMFGAPAAIIFAEAIQKGFNLKKMNSGWTYARGSNHLAKEEVYRAICRRQGFCPADKVPWSVSRTLEYSWADYVLYLAAKKSGHSGYAKQFRRDADAYKSLWNPKSLHFQPKTSKGDFLPLPFSWMTPFLDLFSTTSMQAYAEGSIGQWRWTPPLAPVAIVDLFPSPDKFVKELQAFFQSSARSMGAFYPGSGYWHGNQHDIHAAYLFLEVNRPDLTQKWIHWIRTDRYATGSIGIDGNDDGGTLSAWYVFSALGFYPIAGSNRYWIGTPSFKQAEIQLGQTKLVISQAGNTEANMPYVERVELNGDKLCTPYLTHEDIKNGGSLVFHMREDPVTTTFSC